MWRSLAENRLAAFLALVTLVSIAIHNAATHHDPDDSVSGTPARLPIRYGWPLAGVEGLIGTEGYFYSTFPPQFWAETTNAKPLLVGMALNCSVAVVLVCSVFVGTRWLQSRLRLRFSIATLLGLSAFAALCVHHRIRRWHWLHDTVPDYPRMDLTDTFFDYAEIVVWVGVFAACLWFPHVVAGILKFRPSAERT